MDNLVKRVLVQKNIYYARGGEDWETRGGVSHPLSAKEPKRESRCAVLGQHSRI